MASLHDPRPRRAGSALVRQGPALLCAISRLVGPGRASQWSWGRPLHWREARRTSAKWDEALQYNGGGGASTAQHRSCFLPARLPKPRCKLRTANSQLSSSCCFSIGGENLLPWISLFVISSEIGVKVRGVNPMDLIHSPLLIISIWKIGRTGFEV